VTLTIEVTPELENQLRQAAARAGVAPDEYVLKVLQQDLRQASGQSMNLRRLSSNEATLLQKINQSLSQIEWQRYRELLTKRDRELLTAQEQREIIALSDQIEEANVRRVQSLVELAEIRQTPVSTLIHELGIRPVNHG
jgi:hypothetical protein